MNDWLTASAILLSGLVVGFMFVYSMKRPARTGEAERRDLEAKLDARVQQLRELDDIGGGSPEERARLESEAAEAMRQLETSGASVATSTPTPPAGENARRHTKQAGPMAGFLWGAGSVAAIAALVFFVTNSAKQREGNEGLTGGQPTGAAPMQQPAVNDPVVTQLEAAVKANPEDLSLRDDLAKAQLDHENFLAVIEQTRYVLQRAPNDARALTYEALARIAAGDVGTALKMLEAATKSDPSLLETWVALAWIYTQAGRSAEAEAAMQQALTRHPEERVKLTEVFARMKAAPIGEAAAAQPAPQPAAAPSGPSVHVSISVADASRIGGNAVLFVFARAAGVTGGPPAAVKRLPASGFPLEIDLSAADSMMGQPLPDKLRIEARIDSDGNAMTKDPSDPTASVDNVAIGTAVKLSLR